MSIPDDVTSTRHSNRRKNKWSKEDDPFIIDPNAGKNSSLYPAHAKTRINSLSERLSDIILWPFRILWNILKGVGEILGFIADIFT